MAMPETHEQWSSWGDDPVKPASIERIGLNFGAPGDRKTRDGTLWLDYPSIGGPSPQIKVVTKPANPTFHYRHSNWMKRGDVWPWVAASAVEGLAELILHDLKPGNYTVKLYFAERDGVAPGGRTQTIHVQGKAVLTDFDILAKSKATMTGIVEEVPNVAVDGTLTINLQATGRNERSLISGVEVIRN